jgi:hypothetical protein|tara:strand:- start:637 stop:822 length:186 start_codon:yes stop_codon:yes gene_type:complete
MEELMDLLVADESPTQVSDKIKDILFAKSADRITNIRPQVAASIFDNPVETEVDDTPEEEV